ncbi:RNase P subunit p30 family protein [Natronobacterium gregoryi]|uniref:Ribonuclease P protein component 3 n=2 Tax=Natronobacterium gregoryi TaxID=44930 RepID=L0ANH2_NATGS|nr:RNase P subunit p30 family protein [Natronobacterium gregoryi]AFZ74752.1 RNase P/RNase MRP subunit p30 [Natronobacterium gregoryi SP2]ELY73440.1 ribonuclease P protein component 3 [Natronobacterium gregoryi SP2]PLK20994.1 ribonuclease P [Natronobacterium gregoryi SP2]SFJ03280.1 ribonuclease P protein subunit Rpp30 [Natronobacterium gregoryi]
MYEAVHAHPDGASTVARLAKTATDYGFEGVVVRNRSDARADYDAAEIREAYGVDVVEGIEIRADDPQQASGAVGNHRTDETIVTVSGGTPALNRFAVENEKVDVLAHPMTGEGDVNHVVAKAADKNGVRLEFDLSGVLRTHGGRRVRTVQSLQKLYEIVDYYDTPYVVSATPTSHLECRSPRELAAVGAEIGLSEQFVEDGLAEWGRLAERNRRIQSEEFIEPGVERGRYEEKS